MPPSPDRYESYYQDKLWKLLPAIYRTLDSDQFDRNGPLREIVNRIGAQAAILRRSIDRLWEDQSVESCDDWIVPYIGDLLATNLVASLNPRAQRLDVAKTIYYRRRKGTVAILEEIAADITGWDARIVESFRRLGRARHGLDPEIGDPADSSDPSSALALQLAEGFIGPLTHTGIGGWADLHNVYGATKAHTAFDEFFHTADFRKGRGRSGWYNIPKLAVFLWRLFSFGGEQSDPVAITGCNGHYTFDPTGRQIPLFAASRRAFGDAWVSPQEWMLPTPISTALLNAALADPADVPLYAVLGPGGGINILPNALGVYRMPGFSYEIVDPSGLRIFPELGRFQVINPPLNDRVYATYHYGFASRIGAGPYDRRVLGEPAASTPGTRRDASGGGNNLTIPLGALAPTGFLSINDSLTYTAVAGVNGIQQVTVMSHNTGRPLIRLAPPAPDPTEWIFTGQDGSSLRLDGLFISGGDIVLQGQFDSVFITCCTFDPGDADPTGAHLYTKSADNRDLVPCRLWVEAEIGTLTVDRSIVGPVRTRNGGEIETLAINDSIVQWILPAAAGVLDVGDIGDPTRLVERLRDALDPLSAFLQAKLAPATEALVAGYHPVHASSPPASALVQAVVQDLNTVLQGPSIYDPARFAHIPLSSAVLQLAASNPVGADLLRLNRELLEAGYAVELAGAALAMKTGLADLQRASILGPAWLHRLEASESILHDVFLVENAQDGCVRFSAWAVGSLLPRKYESVEVAPRVGIFTSRRLGEPGYAQLLEGADRAILSGAKGATICAGAQNGSEMGAFARELYPIKGRSFLIKCQEFMPLGLTPVLINVA